MVLLSGYPYNWNAADVNGGNVLLYDDASGAFHLNFIDLSEEATQSVFHQGRVCAHCVCECGAAHVCAAHSGE